MLSWLVVGIGDITRKRVLPAILAESRSKLAGIVTRDPREGRGLRRARLERPRLPRSPPAMPRRSTWRPPVFLHAAADHRGVDHRTSRAVRKAHGAQPCAGARPCSRPPKRTRRTLGIAYYRRMYPKVERARQLIEGGVIGRPVFAEATAHDWFNPVGTSRAWLARPGASRRRTAARHRVAPHRPDELPVRQARARQRRTFHAGAADCRWKTTPPS